MCYTKLNKSNLGARFASAARLYHAFVYIARFSFGIFGRYLYQPVADTTWLVEGGKPYGIWYYVLSCFFFYFFLSVSCRVPDEKPFDLPSPNALRIAVVNYCQRIGYRRSLFFPFGFSRSSPTTRTMSTVQIKCSDGELFDVEIEVAKMSGTIKTMMAILGCNDVTREQQVLSLPNIEGDTFRKVLEWVRHHMNEPAPDQNQNEWNANFLDVDPCTLLELIMAANYLSIEGLFDVVSDAVDDVIRGKSSGEIRSIFRMALRFGPEEEALILRFNNME